MEIIPEPLHQNDAHSFFIKIIQHILTRKIQRSNRSGLTNDRCRKTYKLDEGGGHVGAHARTSHSCKSLDNRRPHQMPNSELGAQTGPANLERTPLHTLKKSPPSSSSYPSSVRIKSLTLPGMPSMPPWCQTTAPPYVHQSSQSIIETLLHHAAKTHRRRW
jgi:hypothetical protein